MQFAGKTILITGAGSGIGRSTAELLAREGAAQLLLVDKDGKAVENLELGCAVRCLPGDVSEEAFWQSVELGRIDHAVVNAGIAGTGVIQDLDFSEWRRVLSVNLDGAFLSLRSALRSMRDGGSIVAVASVAGIKAEPAIAAYGSSKAAVIQLFRIAAKETAERQIRVNVVAPGAVETPIWDEVPMFAARAAQIGRAEALAEMASTATPLRRYAAPQEIAWQIAFLLSDACKNVTGAVFVSDGGYSL